MPRTYHGRPSSSKPISIAIAREGGFRLRQGEAEFTPYRFNTGKNHHYFCRHCGVRPFGVGTETPISKRYGAKVGCLERVSEAQLAVIPGVYVDGMPDARETPPEVTAHLRGLAACAA